MLSNRLYDKYKKRLNIFKIIIFFFTIVILINFLSIQIFSRNLYIKQISIQTTAEVKREGDRGKIYDRNNKLLGTTIDIALIISLFKSGSTDGKVNSLDFCIGAFKPVFWKPNNFDWHPTYSFDLKFNL